MTIEEFYKDNKCNQFFDEEYYVSEYKEVDPFYKEHCIANSIPKKERLYFHWATCGVKMGFMPHKEELYHICAFSLEEIKNNYDFKDRILKMFFNIITSTEQEPNFYGSNKKDYYINILKYYIENVELKDRTEEDAFND